MLQSREKFVTYDDLNKRAKNEAAARAIWGIECAFRANIAYDAMQAGDTVQTVPSEFNEPVDAAKIYEVLVNIAGSTIGRTDQGQDTIGSLAYQALYTRSKYYRRENLK